MITPTRLFASLLVFALPLLNVALAQAVLEDSVPSGPDFDKAGTRSRR